MGTKICMNVSCGTSNTHEWKTGWPLRSGGFAHLCYKCGAAYEKSVFCDTFHIGETGWRDCSSCHKPLHCGCVASRSLYECLDYGGVGCLGCANSSQPRVIQSNDVLNGFGGLTLSNVGERKSTSVKYRAVGDTVDEGKYLQLCGTVDEGKLLQLCKIMEANESNVLPESPKGGESTFLESNLFRPQTVDKSDSLGQTKGQEIIHQIAVNPGYFSATQSSIGSLTFSQSDNGRPMLEVNHMSKLSPQPSLSMSLGAPSATASFAQPFTRGHVDGIEQSSTPSSFQQAQKPRPILPRPQKPVVPTSPDTSKNVRVARPPAEGRGKNQLLPRYWPRITDQELQKLSGALNSTIVPLFEKVLSASDAGRIGRLVLPKACAEAYFPPISQSEGLPLRIQDVKGNEWTFQFRFWPNNNSRMYVLEGVTPCIQSMRLQAGDTVTFSRRDPGNKLVIGFRKASQSANTQGHQTSILPNGNPGPTSFSSGVEHVATGSGDSSIFRMNNGSKDTDLNSPSDQLSEWEMYMQKNDNNGHRTSQDSLQPVSNSEKKRTRNIGPKSKRLHMHSEDVMELRLTWEEAQELLRPPPSVSPNIVTIEEHEFEEYDEPPVFGKRTIFTTGPSKQEQWAQCDNCSKWRKLPVDVLLPPRWTCQENSWDSSRCSCSAPEEISPKQLDNLLSSFVPLKGLKKRRKITEKENAEEHEPSGLDALASAAILGDKVSNSGEQSVAATTKHPRHRPGCSCIVCIQPPSGKGKHKSSCTCNVCMTVKRRFKTMMQRKNQKRQLEREAQISQMENDNYKEESELNGTTSGEAALHMNHSPESSQRDNNHKDESEVNGTTSGDAALHMNHSSENGASSSQSRTQADATESSSARQIDLNCEPFALLKNPTLPDLLKLAKAAAAARPSEKYANESCLRNMTSDEQAGIASLSSTPQANGVNERCLLNEASLSSAAWTSPSVGDKACREPDLD